MSRQNLKEQVGTLEETKLGWVRQKRSLTSENNCEIYIEKKANNKLLIKINITTALLMRPAPNIHAIIRNTFLFYQIIFGQRFIHPCHALSDHEMAVIHEESFIP